MRLSVNRLFAALPDAITAGVFLTTWIDPSIAGPATIKNLMLTMLMEFLVVHSGGFYAGIAAADVSRSKRVMLLTGLSLFYVIFIGAFAAAFDSPWPIFAFAWLFVCRFFHLWMRPGQAARETDNQIILWAASVATYVLGGIATVMLPLPALGITPEFVASMHLPGSGEWVRRPYTVLAFGTLYFAVQAFAKYKATPETVRRQPAPAT
jgi:hypothetical protein